MSAFCPHCRQLMPADFSVNLNDFTLSHGGRAVRLTLHEAVMTEKLARARPRYVPMGELIFAVYNGAEPEDAASAMRVRMTQMRAKIASVGLRIANINRAGYRIEELPGGAVEASIPRAPGASGPRLCAECKGATKGAKFCGSTCRQKFTKQKKATACAKCGIEFYPPGKQKFCSRDCYCKAWQDELQKRLARASKNQAEKFHKPGVTDEIVRQILTESDAGASAGKIAKRLQISRGSVAGVIWRHKQKPKPAAQASRGAGQGAAIPSLAPIKSRGAGVSA